MARQRRLHKEADLTKQDSASDPLPALLQLLAAAVASRLVRPDEEDVDDAKGQSVERADASSWCMPKTDGRKPHGEEM
jgi:hypothetical protein